MSRIERVGAVHPEGGRVMTKQSMAAESDVNQIVSRHVAHGLPFLPDGRARYGDFSSYGSYHDSLDAVRAAEDEFLKLPAAVREHCQNDVGRFLELVFDPSRRAELEKLGLVEGAAPEAAPPATPPPVEGVEPAGTVTGT